MTKVYTFIKNNALLLLVLAGATIFGLYARERMDQAEADATVKATQTDIEALTKQQGDVRKVAKAKVSTLQKEAAKVNTPTEAVEVLTAPVPDSLIPLEQLKAEAIPEAPGRVSVDAFATYQTLNACSVDKVNLAACTQELDLQKQITDKKDVQITALKQKPTFWHRVGQVAKVTGCAAAGAAAGSYVKGAEGAAVGAATAAGVCQLF
jgi:hypothetical protein